MASATSTTLFERIGGEPAISAAVSLFYDKVMADAELRPFFDESRLPRLIRRQAQFFVQALGGPADYKGASMKAAHRKHPIQSKHFEKVVGHLSSTLADLKVPKSVSREVLEQLAPLASDIINTP
jgi:hemoglobin